MKLLTPKQVARLYGVTVRAVRQWASDGMLTPNGERVYLPIAHGVEKGKHKRFADVSVTHFLSRVKLDDGLLTTHEAAKIAGVKHSTLNSWISRGLRINGEMLRLPTTRYSRESGVSRNDLEWFLALRRKERERRRATIDANLEAVIQRRRATMPEGEGRVRNEKRKPSGKQ